MTLRLPHLATLCVTALALAWPAHAAPTKPVRAKSAKLVKASQAAVPTGAVLYATRDDVMRQADDIAQRRDLDPAWVRRALGEAPRQGLCQKLARVPKPLYRPDPHWRWRAILERQCRHTGARRA